MADQTLAGKIACLVRARQWTIEDFSRHAKLNRLTVRQILHGPRRRLHANTVRACAAAFGLEPMELLTDPVDQLLDRIGSPRADAALAPEVSAWLEKNPQAGKPWSADEKEELQGATSEFEIAQAAQRIARRRKILAQADAVAGTEYGPFLEQFLQLLFDKIQPYADSR